MFDIMGKQSLLISNNTLGVFILFAFNKIKLFCLIIIYFGITTTVVATENNDSTAAIVEEVVVKEKSGIVAKVIVTDFQSVLIDAMKQGKALSFEDRSLYFKDAILKSHDVLKSLRTIVGSKEWRSFTDEQKTQLTNVFTKFIVSTYAFNFNSFSGEYFNYVSEHTTKKGNIVVRSILYIPEGKRKKVTFDYALKKNSEGWRIYNIAADGVSDLATRRSEYRRILSGENGFNALIAIINKKIDNYAK